MWGRVIATSFFIMTERQELRFNRMCFQLGFYHMDLPFESQCSGYKKLKE